MKILVIGGTGNISRWFVPQLIREGNEVTLYNRGMHEVKFESEVKRITGDRTNHAAFETDMKKAGLFDCVIDMAGFEPEDARSVVRALYGRTAQYIFCSTVDVYGKRQPSYPVGEDTGLSASAGFPYAAKKVEMEKILWAACEKTGFPLTVIRPAATYSEGWSPLVTCFGGQTYHLDRLRKGREMILHGDGTAIWVATHSQDVANAFIGATGNHNTIGKAYNVTGDELLTWYSMHRLVAEELQAPEPRFVYIPTELLFQLAPEEASWCKENFQFNNIYDNTAAKRDLGFTYTIPFAEGVKRCISYLLKENAIDDYTGFPFYEKVTERWKQILHSLKFFILVLLIPYLSPGQSLTEFSQSVISFGAVADGHTDNTMAFQKAIDSVAVQGGRVYIPAGQFLIGGSIKIKPGVSLFGTNDAPLSPYQLTGTVILATGGRDREEAEPLFEMWNASTAKGFTVYYPDQQTNDIHPYPWTFYIRNPAVVHSLTERRKETFDVTIEDITLINSFNGIRCGPDENGRHRIRNISGCVLRRGIFVDWVGDVGRIENIQFHSHFWFHPTTSGNWDQVFAYMQQNLEAFIFGRSDWEYVTNTFVFPAKVGYKFISTSNGQCNGQFSGIGADATQSALVAESIQSQGLLISNGQFNTHLKGRSAQIIVEKSCAGSLRFTNCGFWGPSANNVLVLGNSFVSFQNCYFSNNHVSRDTSTPGYSIIAENGKLQVQSCTFDGMQTDEVAQWTYGGTKRRPPCILLRSGVKSAIITGNNGYGGVKISNGIGRKAIIRDNEPDGPEGSEGAAK
ncbi:NAD-dependent epimerase/dehydratase family protein [Flavitalea flava]